MLLFLLHLPYRLDEFTLISNLKIKTGCLSEVLLKLQESEGLVEVVDGGREHCSLLCRMSGGSLGILHSTATKQYLPNDSLELKWVINLDRCNFLEMWAYSTQATYQWKWALATDNHWNTDFISIWENCDAWVYPRLSCTLVFPSGLPVLCLMGSSVFTLCDPFVDWGARPQASRALDSLALK